MTEQMSRNKSRNKIQNLKKTRILFRLKREQNQLKISFVEKFEKESSRTLPLLASKWSKIKRYQKNPIMSANLREERKRNIFQLEKEKVSRDLNRDKERKRATDKDQSNSRLGERKKKEYSRLK